MLHFAPWKIALIAGAILLGFFFSLPNFISEETRLNPPVAEGADPEPKGIWTVLPHETVNLGLDLRGGSHIVFEVDMEEVREDRLINLAEDARTTLRNNPPIFSARPAVVGNQVVVRLSDPEDTDRALTRLEDINEPITDAQGNQTLQQTLNIRSDGGNQVTISINDAALESIRQRTVRQSIEVVRRRIDATGTTEPRIVAQGSDRVLVQVPGESDPQRIIDLVGTAARLSFHMVEDNVQINADGTGRTPPGVVIYPTDDPALSGYMALQQRPIVTGDQLVSASQVFDQNGQPAIGFRFNGAGGASFGQATAPQNRGRLFAIVLDDVIISAPRINEPIPGGSGQIVGSFTITEAQDLANMLSAGALPASLTPVDQRSVDPSLGADSIRAGQTAIMIGFGLVIVFMVLAYGYFGFVSTLALIANVMLILGALSGLGATLTLPGIAGIVLTIGMAVDANVLIYERIREEYRLGRTVVNAIEAGYSRAFAAILDANVTTFIAASVLYMMGAGPVRGFAVTLGIGILTSVFTAFTFSRLLISVWLQVRKPKKLAM